jgi:hypothetical protein
MVRGASVAGSRVQSRLESSFGERLDVRDGEVLATDDVVDQLVGRGESVGIGKDLHAGVAVGRLDEVVPGLCGGVVTERDGVLECVGDVVLGRSGCGEVPRSRPIRHRRTRRSTGRSRCGTSPHTAHSGTLPDAGRDVAESLGLRRGDDAKQRSSRGPKRSGSVVEDGVILGAEVCGNRGCEASR